MNIWHRDLYPYFRSVKEALVATTGIGQTTLCQENLDRVVLIFSVGSNANVLITTSKSPGMNQGLLLVGNAGPLIFTHMLHGPLCQCAWLDNQPGFPVNINVLEVVLDRPPHEVK